ncbi:MAG TPA: 4'-phosphopantetheinyl transferase superfamily protein [Oscillatoriaceae cyanobacterium]
MKPVEITWITDRAPDAVHALALEWMQDDERRRHDRFAFEHTRAEYRLARWLVRTALSRHAPVDPAAWRFVANAHGRPAIAAPACDLRFNLTHTPGLLAIAIAEGREVGLDAEDATRPGALESIAHRYFAPRELADLLALPDAHARRERFFALWTLKESYIKARGLGLALPLDSFAFSWQGQRLDFACDARAADEPARWHFRQYRPTARHRLALATERGNGDAPEPRLRFVPFT